MRTTEAASTNKSAAKISGAKRGPAPKAAEGNSSFDQILQKRNAPKPDEPKRIEPAGPKKADRAGKRSVDAAKARPKKTTDAQDPNRAAAEIEPVDTNLVDSVHAGDVGATDEQSSDGIAEEVSADDATTDDAPIENATDVHALSDDATDVEQIINAGIAVGVPADKTIDRTDVNDDDTGGAESSPISGSKASPPIHRAPAAGESNDVAAVADDSESESGATAAVSSLASSPLDGPLDNDDQPIDVPARAENQPAPGAAKAPSSTDPKLAQVEQVDAKPVDESATGDGEQGGSPGGERASNLKLVSDAVDDGESSDGSGASFSLEPANPATAKHAETDGGKPDASLLNDLKPAPAPAPSQVNAPASAQSSERAFAAENHANIVASVRTNLLPDGGTMQIRLNPPELGAIQVAVQMRDGVMNASFETTSDQATRLLSHSLGELRASLENSGVTVDKLHVEQAPRDQQAKHNSPEDRQQQGQAQDSPGRREQERRELLQRMWRKLSEGSDPLDMVA
ncbi:hypothetical protein BH09PLA1_BH09PLA1_22170 [soil metagenome]